MKASELIIKLQETIKEKWDLNILVTDIKYWPDECCSCSTFNNDVSDYYVENNNICIN